MCTYVCVCVCEYECVCVCVCVAEGGSAGRDFFKKCADIVVEAVACAEGSSFSPSHCAGSRCCLHYHTAESTKS